MFRAEFSSVSLLRVATVVMIVTLFAGCTTSPTGRNQMIMFDESTIAPMAAESFNQMKQQQAVSQRKDVNSYVQCVVNPVIDEARMLYSFMPADWEIVVFDSPQVNAFAMPGGKVGVYTGLIDLTENPDQLAAVMGHEVAHVVAHHAAERMTTAQMTVLGLTLAGIALADNEDQAIIIAALGLGAQIGIQLPFSRVHESEADEIGQQLMARAGYNPQEAINLWYLMDQSGGARPPEFLSTHPDPQNRAQRLQAMMPAVTPLYNNAVSAGKRTRCKMPVKPITSEEAKQKANRKQSSKYSRV